MYPKKITPLCLLFLIVYSFSGSLAGSPLLISEIKTNPYPLGQELGFFEDKKGSYSIEEVSSEAFHSKFAKTNQKNSNFGVTSSIYWVRLQLEQTKETLQVETLTDDWELVQFFTQDANKAWNKKEGGRSLAFDNTIFKNNNTVFSIPSNAQRQTIYLRFKANLDEFGNPKPMLLTLRLWGENNFISNTAGEIYQRGMFHGFLLIMVVYNFFLFLSIREKSYLFYSIYLLALSTSIMSMAGVGKEFFWSEPEKLLMHTNMVIFCIFDIFFILFVKSFLKAKKHAPKLDMVLSISMAVDIFVNLLALLGPTYLLFSANVFVLSNAAMSVSVLWIGVICVKKGYKPAKFFLFASSLFIGSNVVASIQSLNLLPGFETGYQFMKMGVLLEAVLYSFALADRFKYEKRLKEDSQKEAILNLIKADQIKDEFLANTSHELRTPLNGIIGLAEATKFELEVTSQEKIETNLSLIIASGRRLSLLVNDILDFSKLKHKKFPLHLAPVQLNRMVYSIIALSQSSTQSKDVVLSFESDPNATWVLADEARLEQILYNLVSNGIKFTKEGQVTIEAKRLNQQVILSVTDTGIGIAKEDLTQIFNAFEQVDGSETRQFEGTGLGLTVVKQLVELHQSSLQVASELGQGSCFSFALEVAEENKSGPEGPITKGKTTQPLSLQPTSKQEGFLEILVVDDDPLNIEVICQQLNSEHYSLRTANHGAKALQMVKEQKPDLILLDVMMPEVSGFEVCEILRKEFHQNHLPIIFLTAKNREADILKGLELGGNDYLTKPFFRSELLGRVETQLEITLHQKQSDSLTTFANNISQFLSQQEMLKEAFGQITHWSFVDQAALFEGDQLLFYKGLDYEAPNLKAPSQKLLKEIDFDPAITQVKIINRVIEGHPLADYYQEGHFLLISPQHLPDHILVFQRNLSRKAFDQSKAAAYAQSMINQIQTTQSNMEALFEDDKLVAVIGKVQPRMAEITHIKAMSPTLELYFDSDKRDEYIDGCSLEKLSLYFNESLFLRTHKSYLVNVSKVKSLHKVSKSRLLHLELTTGEMIPVGRTYVEKTRLAFANLT